MFPSCTSELFDMIKINMHNFHNMKNLITLKEGREGTDKREKKGEGEKKMERSTIFDQNR